MNPPSIRVDEVVLHRVGDERFASLSEQKEADMEMGLDLRHPHDNMGQERPTTLFEQKVNNPNMETQLVEVSHQLIPSRSINKNSLAE